MFQDHVASAKAGRPVWVAVISLGSRDGRRIRHKAHATSERAAKAELAELRRRYGASGDVRHQTLDQYLEAWLLGHRRVRSSTLVSYGGHVRLHISPLLGGIPIAKLQPGDVDRLIVDRLEAGLSPATVVRIVTTLRIALGAGVRRGELHANVAARVDLPRVERHEIEPLTTEDAAAILDVVEGTWLEHIVRLLLGSGIRLGEACALNQGDLALDQGFVRLRKSKTEIRAVPISEDAVDALRAALAAAPRIGRDEPVFFNQRRNRQGVIDRLPEASVSHAFPRLLERAGLRRMVAHGLRHGAATLMLAEGHSLSTIGKQLGHRSQQVTAMYAHVMPSAQRSAIAALDVRKRRAKEETHG